MDYLVHHHHYLGLPKLVGEHFRNLVAINGLMVACLSWASAAWKVKARDQFTGWDEETKRRNLHLIVNNTRFLIPDWVRVKHLTSRVLALNLRRLNTDWQRIYGHPVYLAETFVDITRFSGTCYRAANWIFVGQTKGSAKEDNAYLYHRQPKAIRYGFIPCIAISGGTSWVARDEAKAILALPQDKAFHVILALAEKAEKYDQIIGMME